MMYQYVQSEFQKAQNLSDIFRISKELKSKNIDVALVNKYATLAKLAIAQKRSNYKVIPKERVRMSSADSDYVSQANIMPEHLHDFKIVIDNTNYII